MTTEGNQQSFNKSASSSLPTNKKILKIEDIVDKILEENKNKPNNIEITKYINPSVLKDKRICVNPVKVEDFSPRKRRPHSIYFVRKQPSKKDIKKDKEQEKKTSNKEPIKVKKRIRFGKQTTQATSQDKSSEKPLRKTEDFFSKPKKSIPVQKTEESNPRTKKLSMWAKKKSLALQKDVDQQQKKKSSSEKKLDDVDHVNEDEARWIDVQIGKTSEFKTKNETVPEGKIEEVKITKKRSVSETEEISNTNKEQKNKQRLNEGSASLVDDTKGNEFSDNVKPNVSSMPVKQSNADDRNTVEQKEISGADTSLLKKARAISAGQLQNKEGFTPSIPKDQSNGRNALNDADLKPFGTAVETEAVLQQFPTTSTSQQISPKSSPANQIIKGKSTGVISQEALFLKNSTLKELGLSEKQWEELDFYPLHEPFAYVEIVRDTESLDKRYVLVEVGLTEEEANALKFMQQTLKILPMNTVEMDEKGIDAYLREKIEQIFEEYKLDMDPSSKEKIIYYLEKNYLGLGRINAVMQDPNIEDISCDGSNVPIFLYHREYGSLKSNIVFPEEEELSGFVVRLAQKCGKHISIAEPMLDATMPDGSRIQMTLSAEVTAKGSTFTIRKFKEDPFSPPDLIEFNTMSSEMVAYMWMAVENGVNALIAGGTASGKTSTLNALSLFIPREAKIVSIEETREINLPHPNWIPGVTRSGFGEVVADKIVGEIDMYDLMKAALRQRPEYILVGEIRGKEAYVLFQAMATGHTTYSTVHADSAQSLIHRLEGKPIEIPRIMLQALDIVCIQVTTRVKNKRARRCKQIIEIIDIDPTTKEILTNEVFRWDPIEDIFIYSGKSYVLESIRAEKDISRDDMTLEVKNRARLLEWMNSSNIRDFREVATVLARYAENPSTVLEEVKSK